jgi:hypothetical protein
VKRGKSREIGELAGYAGISAGDFHRVTSASGPACDVQSAQMTRPQSRNGFKERFQCATKSDPVIGIFIDHNVWHRLFALHLDLAAELPSDEVARSITREAEFEIAATTEPTLKAYIDNAIAKCRVITDTYFGFYCERLPDEEQRIGGFDVGRWASTQEKTKLYSSEAAISLAARSFDSVVLPSTRNAALSATRVPKVAWSSKSTMLRRAGSCCATISEQPWPLIGLKGRTD